MNVSQMRAGGRLNTRNTESTNMYTQIKIQLQSELERL